MPSIRGLSATAVLAALSVVAAAPAWADPALNRTYTLVWNDGEQSTWMITSTCDTANSCVARVASGSSNGGATVHGEARLADGRWTMAMDKPDGARCDDGSRAPQHNEYSWDATTLSGTLVATAGPICSVNTPRTATYTFTMAQVV